MSVDITKTADAYEASLKELKHLNLAIAQQAAAAAFVLGERLALEAQRSEDPETIRKAYDSFTRKSEVPEKTDAANKNAAVAAAVLQIILDDTVPQVAPPKRERALQPVEEVVDVVPLPAPAEDTDAVELAWGDV